MLFLHAVEQGLIYGLMALGVYLSFRVLSFPDLSVDGALPLGAAMAAMLVLRGFSPYFALLGAFGAGLVAGAFTGVLATRLRIPGLLAGVLTMIMLYSLNLRIMGRPNLPLLGRPSALLGVAKALAVPRGYESLVASGIFAGAALLVLLLFLHTELGGAMRAVGQNPEMVRTLGTAPENLVVLGLALSNGLVALSGALVSQYSGFADVGMGIGTIVAGLASVMIGELLWHPRGIFTHLVAVIFGSLVYRMAISLALRYGASLGFTASDLRLLTALVVLGALAAPVIRAALRGEEA
ncbi:MAG: ABC transporter permease [Candidatus Bipolaricaulaceae bacterium]